MSEEEVDLVVVHDHARSEEICKALKHPASTTSTSGQSTCSPRCLVDGTRYQGGSDPSTSACAKRSSLRPSLC